MKNSADYCGRWHILFSLGALDLRGAGGGDSFAPSGRKLDLKHIFIRACGLPFRGTYISERSLRWVTTHTFTRLAV